MGEYATREEKDELLYAAKQNLGGRSVQYKGFCDLLKDPTTHNSYEALVGAIWDLIEEQEWTPD